MMDYSSYEKPEVYWKKKSKKTKLVLIAQVLLGIPKSILFNLHYFGLEGIKLPVLVSSKTKMRKMKGSILINAPYKTGMIKLGFQAPEMYDNSKLSFIWINDGLVEFENTASIRNGSVIRNYGHLIMGNKFHISAPSRIICYKHIRFGSNVLIGWDCEFADGDAHKIYDSTDFDKTERKNVNKSIIIGDRVWFSAHVKTLKGVIVGNDTVIAEGTVLSKSFKENNIVVGGNPPKILKKDIVWEI